MGTPKIRTLAELSDSIDGDLGWRRKELSYLRTAIGRNTSHAQATYIRASIAILYAHWEGFVVSCLRFYFSYVTFQREPLSKLVPAIRVGPFFADLKRMEREQSSMARAEFLKSYDETLAKAMDLKGDRVVDAESNLNSGRFLGLVACAGMDAATFQSASKFLDESLLARRNAICHGESVDLDAAGYASVERDVLHLMDLLKNQAIDYAVNRKFMI